MRTMCTLFGSADRRLMRCCSTTCWLAPRRTAGGFVTQPDAVALSHYVGVLSPENAGLRDRIKRDSEGGDERWPARGDLPGMDIWNSISALFARVLAGESIPPVIGYQTDTSRQCELGGDAAVLSVAAARATVTLVLSCGAMLLAVALGIRSRLDACTAVGSRSCADRLRELIRGTPLLLQLLFCTTASQPPSGSSFVAALIGLALNYAAYESEIYRGALLAVPVANSKRPARSASPNFRTLRLSAGHSPSACARTDDQRFHRAAQRLVVVSCSRSWS